MSVSNRTLQIQALRTRIFHARESLDEFVISQVPKSHVRENMILAVTSKIVSLAEGRLQSRNEISKSDLIAREAEHSLGEIGYGSILTIKEGLFIASAGIDESNSESGDYILYPENPFDSAKALRDRLATSWQLKNFGVLLTDSHTTPLRLGVTGLSLAYWGFSGLQDRVGSKDLFGRPLQMTKVNVADGLGAAATLMMGESDESRPLACIWDADVEFTTETDPTELRVALEDDLYYPFFRPHLSGPAKPPSGSR
ncbi:putative folate metabolism gamma-glutamate ligase [soil metagenome]